MIRFVGKAVLLILTSVTATGCGAAFDYTDLTGVWYSDCYADGTDGKRTCYIFDVHDVTITTRTWVSNVNCPGSTAFENVDSGVFILQSTLSSPTNSRQMDVDLATDSDYFDLIQLVDASTFRVGDKSGSLDGTTEEKRPTEAESVDYIKQTSETDCSNING